MPSAKPHLLKLFWLVNRLQDYRERERWRMRLFSSRKTIKQPDIRHQNSGLNPDKQTPALFESWSEDLK